MIKHEISRGISALAAVLTLVLVLPGTADAQFYVGPQLNVATETDVGVGARVLANVERMNLELVGSLDLYFPDGPTDFWELNANTFYHFHLPENPAVLPYLGGGLNVANISNGGDQTEVGVNLGGGVRFPFDNISPFIEGRTVISDLDQAVFTFGFLLGHAHGP